MESECCVDIPEGCWIVFQELSNPCRKELGGGIFLRVPTVGKYDRHSLLGGKFFLEMVDDERPGLMVRDSSITNA